MSADGKTPGDQLVDLMVEIVSHGAKHGVGPPFLIETLALACAAWNRGSSTSRGYAAGLVASCAGAFAQRSGVSIIELLAGVAEAYAVEAKRSLPAQAQAQATQATTPGSGGGACEPGGGCLACGFRSEFSPATTAYHRAHRDAHLAKFPDLPADSRAALDRLVETYEKLESRLS